MDDLAGWLSEGYTTAYRTAYLILRNGADAEEAVQEAFLRAWRFRDSLDDDTMVQPWLYRVVVNTCCTKLRREARHRDRRAGDDLLDPIPSPLPSPEAAAGDADVAGRLLAALASLPDGLRVPIVLRYYTGLSEREIARAIGRRPGTVKSRLHEGRRRLAELPEVQDLAGVIGSTS